MYFPACVQIKAAALCCTVLNYVMPFVQVHLLTRVARTVQRDTQTAVLLRVRRHVTAPAVSLVGVACQTYFLQRKKTVGNYLNPNK